MPRQVIDTSRAKCDTCGKPYKPGDAVYSLADKYDDSIEDRDVLVSFRHWECHVPLDKALEELRNKARAAEQMVRKLKW